jgi:BirA family biotin operon repressor/biotin-[acetyl-CoA-carboxylase] ligase
MTTAMSPATNGAQSHLAADSLCIDLIRRELVTETVGFAIHLFRDVSSTNDALRPLAEAGAREGTVVLAESQRGGRGRLGKAWFSPEGVNLYVSVLFRPKISPRAVPVFCFIASLALADAIAAEGVPAGVRWPNDVLVGGRKVAGTLSAVATSRDVVDSVILGVGVNLNVSRGALERGLGPAADFATSLRESVGHPIDRNHFAASFLNHLPHWFDVYTTRGLGAILVAWKDRDVLRGRVVEVRAAGGTYRGRVAGVDDEGRLVLEQGPAAERTVVCGEITTID